jgi:hypothetical protein
MASFMLLLWETPSTVGSLSAEEIQQVIEKYQQWSKKTAEAGRLKGGQKLMEEGGKCITEVGSRLSVVDGPYSETKEVIGGYFTIEARDYDDAVAAASDCPHLKFGRIEVRRIDPMDGTG